MNYPVESWRDISTTSLTGSLPSTCASQWEYSLALDHPLSNGWLSFPPSMQTALHSSSHDIHHLLQQWCLISATLLGLGQDRLKLEIGDGWGFESFGTKPGLVSKYAFPPYMLVDLPFGYLQGSLCITYAYHINNPLSTLTAVLGGLSTAFKLWSTFLARVIVSRTFTRWCHEFWGYFCLYAL